ncbi:hypothetical protein J6590_065095 [Homalodisca vitripennis]|nr:hypothetical protein J6590_065095 [Homalodisca vitripennis]
MRPEYKLTMVGKDMSTLDYMIMKAEQYENYLRDRSKYSSQVPSVDLVPETAYQRKSYTESLLEKSGATFNNHKQIFEMTPKEEIDWIQIRRPRRPRYRPLSVYPSFTTSLVQKVPDIQSKMRGSSILHKLTTLSHTQGNIIENRGKSCCKKCL